MKGHRLALGCRLCVDISICVIPDSPREDNERGMLRELACSRGQAGMISVLCVVPLAAVGSTN
jgi:hypothetical protein